VAEVAVAVCWHPVLHLRHQFEVVEQVQEW
jgi:hypothetical protein